MIGEPWLPEGERQMTPAEFRRASNYGYQVDRMRALDATDGQRKPIWNFVELGWPLIETAAQGGRRIQPAGNSRGGLAQHHRRRARNHLLRPQLRRVRAAGSTSPRPVLPGEPGDGEICQRADQGSSPRCSTRPRSRPARRRARRSGRWSSGTDGHFYVFAGSRETTRRAPARSSIPCVGNATAVRLGEAGVCRCRAGRSATTSRTATRSTSTASTAGRGAACRCRRGGSASGYGAVATASRLSRKRGIRRSGAPDRRQHPVQPRIRHVREVLQVNRVVDETGPLELPGEVLREYSSTWP